MNGADAMLAKSAVWAKPSCNICPVNGRILNNGKKNDGTCKMLMLDLLSTGNDS